MLIFLANRFNLEYPVCSSPLRTSASGRSALPVTVDERGRHPSPRPRIRPSVPLCLHRTPVGGRAGDGAVAATAQDHDAGLGQQLSRRQLQLCDPVLLPDVVPDGPAQERVERRWVSLGRSSRNKKTTIGLISRR